MLSFLNDTPAADVPAIQPSWKRCGDIWSICYGERTIHVRHAKGLADLAILLGRPGQSFEALELYAGPGAPWPSAPEPIVDRQALVAYRTRLTELAGELEQAELHGDLEWSDRVQAEHEALLEHLRQITGFGGRVRTEASPAERARKAVSARIRDAIAKVGRHDPELAAHLTAAVSTGATCTYQPERPIVWST
jgi:hypothetical protein